MNNNSNKNKEEILGMPFGTACARLRKMILFSMLKGRSFTNICYGCKLPIENVDELTIEHKIPWQRNGAEHFWDMENISFSHRQCNRVHVHGGGRASRKGLNGTLRCGKCLKFLLPDAFHLRKNSATGRAYYCKKCK